MTHKLARHRVLTAAILTFAVSTSISPVTAIAQENDGWKFRISPYLWMLGLDGTTAALGNNVAVDASFSDILDLLNIALSANMELSKGNFLSYSIRCMPNSRRIMQGLAAVPLAVR